MRGHGTDSVFLREFLVPVNLRSLIVTDYLEWPPKASTRRASRPEGPCRSPIGRDDLELLPTGGAPKPLLSP